MNKLFKTMTGASESEAYSSPENVSQQGKAVEKGSFVASTAKGNSDFVLINNLILNMHIGVTPEERRKKQRVIVNLEIEFQPNDNWKEDNIDNVLSYIDVKNGVENITEMKSFKLVETFAEYIAEYCLSFDQTRNVKVSIYKPDVLDDIESLGISIYRSK